jgi:hypothetical protein
VVLRRVRRVAGGVVVACLVVVSLVPGVWIAERVLFGASEDTAIVWVCPVDGNGECGPGQPWVDVRF